MNYDPSRVDGPRGLAETVPPAKIKSQNKNLCACSLHGARSCRQVLPVNPDRTQTESKNGFSPLNEVNVFIIKGLVHFYAAPKRSAA